MLLRIDDRGKIALLGWYSCTVEFLIRWEFGERDLRARLGPGLVSLGLIWYVADGYNADRRLFSGIILAYILAALGHLLYIWRRNYRGDPIYGGMSGMSWLKYILPARLGPLPLTEGFLYIWLEPGLCGLLGYGLLAIDPLTGFWLLSASLAMKMRSALIFKEWRRQRLEYRDAQKYGEMLNQSMTHNAGTQTERIRPVTLSTPPEQHAETPDVSATVHDTLYQSVTADQRNQSQTGEQAIHDLIRNTVRQIMNEDTKTHDES